MKSARAPRGQTPRLWNRPTGMPVPLRRLTVFFHFTAAFLAAGGTSHCAHAQLGSGWVATNFTKRIHLDDEVDLQTFSWTASKFVCTPTCADYNYDEVTDTETFRIFDSRSNRSEIRLQNDYTAGTWQF